MSDSAGPRAYTAEEMRDRFLSILRGYVDYWEGLPNQSVRERLEGVVFSTLVVLDGGCVGFPGCDVIPRAHPDDEEYHRERGENWYPDDVDICDGELHSQFLNPKAPTAEELKAQGWRVEAVELRPPHAGTISYLFGPGTEEPYLIALSESEAWRFAGEKSREISAQRQGLSQP